MHVAFDVGPVRAEPAGVGIYVASLADALAATLPPTELSYIGLRSDSTIHADGHRISPRSERLPYPAWVELFAARDAKRTGADVVHYTDGLVPPIRHGRTVVTVMDLSMVRQWRSHRIARYPRIPLVLLAPRLADLVVVAAAATADEVIRLAGVAADRIEVVPLAARPDLRPASDDDVPETLGRHGLVRDRYVLSLGTIEPRKNHLRLIQAFERLAASGGIADDVPLVMVGKPGWRHEPVLQAIEASPVRDRIRRLGYLPPGDLPALLTGAGVVAYVSTYEGFGLPILEAMTCGAPVVTSGVSSMPEVAGDAAVLVDPLDVDAIAAAIRASLEATGADRQAIRERSISRAATFTWQRCAESMTEIYRRLA